MKKTLLFSALFACLLTSCMKNTSIGDDNNNNNNGSGSTGASNGGSNGGSGGGSTNTSYHVSATIDGKAQSFNTYPLASKIANGGVNMVTIGGFSGTNQSNLQSISLSWTDYSGSGTFSTGTYKEDATGYTIAGVYSPTTSSVYGSGTGFSLGTAAITPLTIVITAIDSKSVKGTFSGDFLLNQGSPTGKKAITNGDFYVPWQ